jgi:membrane associated rhomboid family serine protease
MGEPAAPPVCYRHTDRETYISCQRCGKPICPDCMRSAAVGFQCPDCVREGARETRSGRTAYGGQRSGNPARTSQVIVAINVAVWVLIVATGWTSSELVEILGLIPDRACVDSVQLPSGEIRCTEVQDGVAQGSTWQLVTVMFTHVQLWHIGFNMLALWVLGPQLELALGRARFLALYLLSGLAASATIYWLADPFGVTVGASGAIFGLLGALMVVAIKVKGNVRSILAWVAVNFVLTFTVPNISWPGHVGGFLAGSLIAALLVYAPKEHRALFQWLSIAGIALAIVVAVLARTAALTG